MWARHPPSTIDNERLAVRTFQRRYFRARAEIVRVDAAIAEIAD